MTSECTAPNLPTSVKQTWLALLVLATATGCGVRPTPASRAAPAPLPSAFEHAWVMHESWYLACAVAVLSNKCWYWFESDVVDRESPRYPLVLDCVHDAKGLRLNTDVRVYATNFLAVVADGATNLLAESDGGNPRRLFRPDSSFDATDPFHDKVNAQAGRPADSAGSPVTR